MSCGLGAVILIFLILKHGESSFPEQTTMLVQDIKSAEIDKKILQTEINKRTEQSDLLNLSIEKKEAELENLKSDLIKEQNLRTNLLNENRQTREEINKLEESIILCKGPVRERGNISLDLKLKYFIFIG